MDEYTRKELTIITDPNETKNTQAYEKDFSQIKDFATTVNSYDLWFELRAKYDKDTSWKASRCAISCSFDSLDLRAWNWGNGEEDVFVLNCISNCSFKNADMRGLKIYLYSEHGLYIGGFNENLNFGKPCYEGSGIYITDGTLYNYHNETTQEYKTRLEDRINKEQVILQKYENDIEKMLARPYYTSEHDKEWYYKRRDRVLHPLENLKTKLKLTNEILDNNVKMLDMISHM